MKPNIYFLISSLKNESPVKAMIALANNLDKNNFNIYIIFFYNNSNLFKSIDCNVNIINLSSGPFFIKCLRLRSFLKKDISKKISISYGITGDLFNFIFRNHFNFSISNIRGTLHELYILKFGKYFGNLILFFHNFLIKNNHYIFVLNLKIKSYYENRSIGKYQLVFNNFLDCGKYPIFPEKVKDSTLVKFVFLGSLTKEKGFFMLIDLLSNLYASEKKFLINILGSSLGEDEFVKSYLSSRLPEAYYNLLGHIDEPYKYLVDSNYLIHPSYSEGTPRSILESLHYGIPVIVRESVSNGLVINLKTGIVFNDDIDLHHVLLDILNNKVILTGKIAIPIEYTKDFNVKRINKFLKEL
jgi:glycosyltransferase involved in cell wall biosynthesis